MYSDFVKVFFFKIDSYHKNKVTRMLEHTYTIKRNKKITKKCYDAYNCVFNLKF